MDLIEFRLLKKENPMGKARKDAPSETDKDRCQSGKAFEICDLSDGRGDGVKVIVL